jgi:hypothetical protein
MYSTIEPDTQASRTGHQQNTTRQLSTTMRRQHNAQSIQNEGRICLAISAIKKTQLPSVRCPATVYNVPKSTLFDRRNGITVRCDCEPNSKKLTKCKCKGHGRGHGGVIDDNDVLGDKPDESLRSPGEGPQGEMYCGYEPKRTHALWWSL